MAGRAESKGIGLIVARVRDASLPDRPNLPIQGIPLWKRSINLLRTSGVLDTVLFGSDSPALVDAAREMGCDAYPISGVGAYGGLSDGVIAGDIVRAYEASKGPLSPMEILAVPDIGAVCLAPEDIAAGVGTVYSTQPYAGCVSTSVNLPIMMVNFRKGVRVMWHQCKTKINRRGICVNGALYVVRAGVLKETGKLLTGKSAILPLPKQRSIVITDGLDYISAKAYLENA